MIGLLAKSPNVRFEVRSGPVFGGAAMSANAPNLTSMALDCPSCILLLLRVRFETAFKATGYEQTPQERINGDEHYN